MPAFPFAELKISVNGDTAAPGSRDDLAFGDTIQLSSTDTAHPQAFKYEIFAYPVGFTLPAGWTADPSGPYYYASGATPPPFNLAADPTWGKYLFRLTINNGDPGVSGLDPSQFVDQNSGANVYDPDNGFEDVALLEASQFSETRPNGVRPIQDNLRRTTGSGTVSGVKGDKGDTGLTGLTGIVGFTYLFASSTDTASDPSIGNFRLNNATHSAATRLAIHNTDANANAIEAFLLAQDDSTSTGNRGQILIRSRATPATFRVYNITNASADLTASVEFVVTHVVSGGVLTAAEPCDIYFTRTGDKGTAGDPGDTGGDGAAPPWSTTFIVDADTIVETDDQDGSVGAPYASIQAAIDDHASLDAINLLVVPPASGIFTENVAMDRFNGPKLRIASMAPGSSLYLNDQPPPVIIAGDIALTGAEGAGYLTLQDVQAQRNDGDDAVNVTYLSLIRSKVLSPMVTNASVALYDADSSAVEVSAPQPVYIKDLRHTDAFTEASTIADFNPFPANYRFTGGHLFTQYLMVTTAADTGDVDIEVTWTDSTGSHTLEVATAFAVTTIGAYKQITLPIYLANSAVTYTVTQNGVTGTLGFAIVSTLHSNG